MSLQTEPAFTLPGQRTSSGMRNAPSQLVFFSLRNGVMPPSGQELRCGPLSVEYWTKVSSAMPRSSSRSSICPTFLSWSIIVSWYGDCQRPACPRLRFFVCVNMCMCVVLSHTNQGLPALFCRLMKSVAAATNSSSQVSMRFFVSGPVSLIFCLPTLPQRGWTVLSSLSVAQQCMTPRGPKFSKNLGSFG